MSLYLAEGSASSDLSPRLRELLVSALERIGKKKKVLLVPPDHTRIHSRAGELTRFAWQHYGEAVNCILPALGTHVPMTPAELSRMFGDIPKERFASHNWRTDIKNLGEVPAEFIERVSEGKLHYSWPVQLNRLVVEGGHDLILSIGQVVPHEVAGMANYSKNILIGTGGPQSIHRSHYLASVYGMERIMGRAENPVRAVLNYAADHFLSDLPIVYVLTVIGREPDGTLPVRGLFVGDDAECFQLAAELSLKTNFDLLDEPVHKAVVFLDPDEFHSTWLGNKAIYRMRMAMADGGELVVLAPGVNKFGEDAGIDRLIRRYGYRGTPAILAAVASDPELAGSLGAAAHLIHGSSEGRFRIRWCPGQLSREEIESAGYEYGDLEEYSRAYDPASLQQGFNTVAGERVFFVPNPGLGLWSWRKRFEESEV